MHSFPGGTGVRGGIPTDGRPILIEKSNSGGNATDLGSKSRSHKCPVREKGELGKEQRGQQLPKGGPRPKRIPYAVPKAHRPTFEGGKGKPSGPIPERGAETPIHAYKTIGEGKPTRPTNTKPEIESNKGQIRNSLRVTGAAQELPAKKKKTVGKEPRAEDLDGRENHLNDKEVRGQ